MQTRKINFQSTESFEKAYLLPIHQNSRESHEVGDFLSLGRDLQNHVVLDDPFVSSRHVRLEKRQRGYLLRDLHSRNGTFVNGTPVVEAYLQNNDKVMIGESLFLFSKIDRRSDAIMSRNPDWNRQLQRLPALANTDFSLLIIGPSGSGKEIISSWVHRHSSRCEKPYITINCSALSENLIESELFGHVRGAFTGASEDRKGAFEMARGGTLFLDEIGDLPLSLQPKLLRALENREIRPVGSDRSIKTDVRIIAATHKNLKQKVHTQEFREDLFHRLNICRINPPCLIDRMEDFEHLVYEFAKENKVSFSFHAIERLKNHRWPGNIRELKNVVLRAAAYFPGRRIDAADLNQIMETNENEDVFDIFTDDNQELPPLKEIEKSLIIRKLEKHSGNQRKVAEELRMPKSTLHDKIKSYGINPKHYRRRGKATSGSTEPTGNKHSEPYSRQGAH